MKNRALNVCIYKWLFWRVLVFWTLLMSCLLQDVCEATCNINRCSEDFAARKNSLRGSSVSEGPSRPFCLILQEYEKCVLGQKSPCKGVLTFHAIQSSLEFLWQDNALCRQILKQQPPKEGELDLILKDGHLQNSIEKCSYRRGSESPGGVAHCGMFGDPHLKIFNGSFMTCRVKGAWPLLSSSDLAIQVTNEPVGPPEHKATATTKVTVLIKSKNGCSSAKTYEASSENLPKAFVDGTSWSGLEPAAPSVWVEEMSPGTHVLVKVRHINATVGIRKLGRYLTVFVTLPEDVVQSTLQNGDLQLCHQGCPQTERIGGVGGKANHRFTPSMSEKEALSKCKQSNVTDYFLDSCMFDLVSTGDETFRNAAYLAQKDIWEGVPILAQRLFINCTDWPCVWKVNSAHPLLMTSSRTLLGVVLGGLLVPLLFC